MSEPRLADVVRRHSSLLDELFGDGSYDVVEVGPEACELRTDWVEVALAYDWRDQWVSAELKPLKVPDDLSDSYPDHSWLRFCGIEVNAPRKSALDDQQVIDGLNVIRPIVELFKDSRLARDALWFVRGYSHAYTDWASGNWD
jgi:hypothetical protein